MVSREKAGSGERMMNLYEVFRRHREEVNVGRDRLQAGRKRLACVSYTRHQETPTKEGDPMLDSASRSGTEKSGKRTVYAAWPEHSVKHPVVISVELDEDEEVEWTWTHTADGESVVTGYTIIERTDKPRRRREVLDAG
jgi:hypothetical protein